VIKSIVARFIIVACYLCISPVAIAYDEDSERKGTHEEFRTIVKAAEPTGEEADHYTQMFLGNAYAKG